MEKQKFDALYNSLMQKRVCLCQIVSKTGVEAEPLYSSLSPNPKNRKY